ncbi:phosphate ABC transporter permease PtsA [Motiliproteus coralliicola]|uniref:Phosphate transport system permease protein PstA n=1 Tax=Motiliproteus coralliicola TaxID=2283196 RepID=A0A369W8P5_9GAMM|nr:phosphate ABC transporter permease PstA [Motiliproteus coralliicola]RDE18360.1 phosphate ABC transporter permease PtsA [Motiliproteus coralliicola]
MNISVKEWFKSGAPWVWLTGGAVALNVIMVAGLLALIAVRGLGHFWPADVLQADYIESDGSRVVVIGEIADSEDVPAIQMREAGLEVAEGVETVRRDLLKVGNRDLLGSDFRWVTETGLQEIEHPPHLFVAERREWGNFYGFLRQVKQAGELVGEYKVGDADAAYDQLYAELEQRLDRALDIHDQIKDIEKHEIGAINATLERLRLRERSLELKGQLTAADQADIAASRAEQDESYKSLQARLEELYRQIGRDSLVAEVSDGQVVEIELSKVVQVFRPNAMGVGTKLGFYFGQIWAFMTDEPREANTEGGVFPAIFGTVMMVLLMSILVTPFGVVAAVYLREYAKQGTMTRLIRIAVNNLAGVPSIVYGVFGLGFFIYFLGGNIDQLFFPEALPAPTFGTPGLMWASLTLALLTLPVVIVATEEGLSRIPRSIREGSLALGATKAETLWKVVLPMASPAMMTGVILAVARAAGEVAPLMLVGVVKLAPSLPLDGNYPFIHLDQKFMHLGFHIYDVGFQSPNVEAARPLVYATALLLVVVIALLNLSAVAIRNRLREKYKALEH